MAGASESDPPEATERTALLNAEERADSNGHLPAQDSQQKNEHHWTQWPVKVAHLTWSTVARDYVNVFLVFAPLGIVAGALEWDASAVFTLNFFAIIPLASLLSFATEELAASMGQALGGLMNATFGNAVELIVRLFPFSLSF